MYSVQCVQSLPVLRPAPSLPPKSVRFRCCDATGMLNPPDCNQNYIIGHFMVHMAYMAWKLYLDLSFKFGCLVVVTSLISTGLKSPWPFRSLKIICLKRAPHISSTDHHFPIKITICGGILHSQTKPHARKVLNNHRV